MGILDFIKNINNKNKFDLNAIRDREVIFLNTKRKGNLTEMKKNNIVDIKEKSEANDISLSSRNNYITGMSNKKYTKEQVKAVFLKTYIDKPSSVENKESYSRYWNYEYNILDIPKFHQELIDEGYFCDASFDNILKCFKVNELKELLIENGQDVKGLKKEELIELAIKTINNEQQENIKNTKKMYEVSEKGLQYIEVHKEFLNVLNFKKYDIDYKLYLEYKNKYPTCPPRDIAWRILNDRLNEYTINREIGRTRSVYFDMAQFLEEEKPSSDVLYHYILCLYEDINLSYTQQRILEYKSNGYITKKSLLEGIDNRPIAPAIIEKIKEYSEYHIDKIGIRITSRNTLPYKFLKNEEFIEMLEEIYTTSFFEEEKWVNKAIRNAKKIIEEL